VGLLLGGKFDLKDPLVRIHHGQSVTDALENPCQLAGLFAQPASASGQRPSYDEKGVSHRDLLIVSAFASSSGWLTQR
jgi:hypothetical protein